MEKLNRPYEIPNRPGSVSSRSQVGQPAARTEIGFRLVATLLMGFLVLSVVLFWTRPNGIDTGDLIWISAVVVLPAISVVSHIREIRDQRRYVESLNEVVAMTSRMRGERGLGDARDDVLLTGEGQPDSDVDTDLLEAIEREAMDELSRLGEF